MSIAIIDISLIFRIEIPSFGDSSYSIVKVNVARQGI